MNEYSESVSVSLPTEEQRNRAERLEEIKLQCLIDNLTKWRELYAIAIK